MHPLQKAMGLIRRDWIAWCSPMLWWYQCHALVCMMHQASHIVWLFKNWIVWCKANHMVWPYDQELGCMMHQGDHHMVGSFKNWIVWCIKQIIMWLDHSRIRLYDASSRWTILQVADCMMNQADHYVVWSLKQQGNGVWSHSRKGLCMGWCCIKQVMVFGFSHFGCWASPWILHDSIISQACLT